MKKPILYLIVLSLTLLCACSHAEPVRDPASSEPFVQTESNESESIDEKHEGTLTSADFSDSNASKSEEDTASDPGDIPSRDSGADQPGLTETKASDAQESGKAPAPSRPKKEDPPATSEAVHPTETEKPVPPTNPDPVPAQPRAGAEDTLAVAGKICEYLNGYRKQEGAGSAAYLNGLAAYARLRSQQLVSNFAHDTADERAAATQLQYGEYVDPKDFGSEGEPYYRANAREAIAMAGYIGTVDEVAQSFARLIHDSAGHWRYVGAAEYRYMAVGVTYLDGMWYCDVAVAATNTDAL